LFGNVFFYHEESFRCLKSVEIVFDKFTEGFSVVFVFQEVKIAKSLPLLVVGTFRGEEMKGEGVRSAGVMLEILRVLFLD
jgi:hypothetical protein